MENPLEFFKKELNNENPTIRVNAMHRLPIIIYSLKNPLNKKKEILNFLERYA